MKPADRIDERIEAFIDGDMPPDARAVFAQQAAGDELLQRRIDLARTTRDVLRDLDTPPCPPHVTASVIATARRDALRTALRRIPGVLAAPARRWRPVLAVASLVLLVVLASRIGRPAAPDAEVAAALDDVKWTLALLSDVSERTATTVRDDVMEPYVVRSMNRAVEHVFEPTPQPF